MEIRQAVRIGLHDQAHMSTDQEQVGILEEQLEQAVDVLGQLPESAWPTPADRQRFERIFAYAQIVFQATDPDLVGPAVLQQLSEALQQWIEGPEAIVGTSDPWRDRLLDGIARLPASRGRDIEQEVKDAAATFQRSARQRLAALESDFRSTQQEITTARTRLDTINSEITSASTERLGELATAIDEMRTGFEQRLQGYETNLETEREEGLRQRGEQAAAFEEAQAGRTAAANASLEAGKSELELLKASSRREIEIFVNEIRRMKEDSEKLVGVIGSIGTAERYGEDAKQQKKIADVWRWITVGFGLSAIVGVIAAILEKHPAAETYGGKVALSVILGGVATYAANQSKSHRDREKHSRNLQLELTAFSPFIEPLSNDQKEEERVWMVRKTFGRTPAVEDGDGVGPTPLSLVMQRRVKKEEGGETS